MQRLYTSGTLFAHQKSLSKLPVAPLKETCDRFLETAKPLAISAQEFENTKACIAELCKPGGIGHVLHSRLEERSKKHDDGWLAEWWQEYAYMGYRDPVVVFVNYFFGIHFDNL